MGAFVDGPHAFEVVIGPDFRAEEMNDHVARVDQHPIALRQALDAGARKTPVLEALRQVFRRRSDVPRGPSGRHNDGIAQRGSSREIDRHDVFGLVVIEGGDNARQQRRLGWKIFGRRTQT